MMGPTLRYRVPTVGDLPTDPAPMDCWAVTDGRLYAGAIPAEYGGGWELGPWDEPGAARDWFGIELDDVPEAP